MSPTFGITVREISNYNKYCAKNVGHMEARASLMCIFMTNINLGGMEQS